MRPDYIPAGEEARYGIAHGRPQDYVPGPPPPDLPVEQGGSLGAAAAPPTLEALAASLAEEAPEAEEPDPAASPAEPAAAGEEAPPAAAGTLAAPARPKMTAAERRAEAKRLEQEAARLAAMTDEDEEREALGPPPTASAGEDPLAPPESGQKGGESRPGRSSPPDGPRRR